MFQPGNQLARKKVPKLKCEQALKSALKRGGITECGAYRMLLEAWNAQIQKALEGNTESMKLIVERLDGKPKQTIDQNVNVNVEFEQALMAGRQRALEQSSNKLTYTDEPLTIEHTDSE